MGILSERSRYAFNPLEEADAEAERLAEKGKTVIALNRGDPPHYFPTPKYVIDAYVRALREGKTGYGRAIGVKELREAVARRYKKKYNIDLGADQTIITQGVSEALFILNSALINPGDRVVVFRPYYTQYVPYICLAGGRPLFLDYDEERSWTIDTDKLERQMRAMRGSKRIKYIMITNPNNPTGTVLSRNVLEEVVDLANNNDTLIVSDEIYDEIVYNGATYTSICELAKGMPHIILNGASKDFDATGFRIGFAVVPEGDRKSEAIRDKFMHYAMMRLSANIPAQYATAEALDNATEHKRAISKMVKEIENRVNFAVDRLEENEYLTTVRPNGAFYIFSRVDLKSLRFKNDKQFVEALLRKKYVQITRGSGFGKPSHIRIVSLADKRTLGEAIKRINDLCKENAK